VSDGVPFIPVVTDTYTVTGTDGNGCTNTDVTTVTVHPLPTVTLNLPLDTVCLNGGNVTLSGESPAGGVWSGTGVSGNSLDPLVAGVGYDVITYTFTDANSCSASYSDSVWIDLCSGVDAIAEGSSFDAYPNPNNGLFTVMIPELSGDGVLEVTDAIGQLVYSENLSASGNALMKQIDLGTHAGGIYFVRLTANGTSSVQKVMIQR
jgi:hypothetical protein